MIEKKVYLLKNNLIIYLYDRKKGTKEMRSIEVLVLGGGASGMMAAIMAAREHAHVMILEKRTGLAKNC